MCTALQQQVPKISRRCLMTPDRNPAHSAVTLIEDVCIVTPGQAAQPGAAIELGEGRIRWIGSMAQARARPADRRMAGAGALCLPGFVNTHNHTPLMIVRGMVEDLGFAPAYTPGIPQGHWLSEEETYLLARLGQLELLCAGCTTVVDYYRKPAALARAAVDSGLRAFIGGRIMDADTAELAAGRFRRDDKLGDETLRDSMDLMARWQGAADGRLQCIHAPHAADTCSRELLQQVAAAAAADGRQVHTHLAQSALEVDRVQAREGRGPVALFDELGLLNERLFAAHCIFLDQAEITAAGRARIKVCHAPLGNATAGVIAPIEALRAAGAAITLCTDTKSADMIETQRMAIMVARIQAQGRFVLDAKTVLGWATSDGAAALGLSDVGRIEVGCRADLVLLDPQAANLSPVIDGFGIVVHSGSASNVRHVFCDGVQLVADGRPTQSDAREVIRAAQQVAQGLWARAGVPGA
jgi:5-methylthioadenosine/S-adenosylhomocysteine deaminase